MERDDVQARLERARQKLEDSDAHLLENDLSERCIASRLAMYLQPEFPDHHVDVEYNRLGNRVKRLHLPLACVRRPNRNADPPPRDRSSPRCGRTERPRPGAEENIQSGATRLRPVACHRISPAVGMRIR